MQLRTVFVQNPDPASQEAIKWHFGLKDLWNLAFCIVGFLLFQGIGFAGTDAISSPYVGCGLGRSECSGALVLQVAVFTEHGVAV